MLLEYVADPEIPADGLAPLAGNPPPPALQPGDGPPATKTRNRDRSTGESGDQYPHVLFPIPRTHYRVALCPAGWQYLVQQREAKDRWINRKFIARKAHLAVVLKRLVPSKSFRAIEAKLSALPV